MKNMVFPIFELRAGRVEAGARLELYTLEGTGMAIPAILVGEIGRGRKLGVLPVELPTDLRRELEQGREVRLLQARIGQTRSGHPKLIFSPDHPGEEACIAVLRTPIGFRGSNEHTGDRVGENEFAPFPGKILVTGRIAQGAAGRMGSGDQLVALIPRGVIFRTGYSGRLYGKPREHYYMFTGQTILAATWEERQVADPFPAGPEGPGGEPRPDLPGPGGEAFSPGGMVYIHRGGAE